MTDGEAVALAAAGAHPSILRVWQSSRPPMSLAEVRALSASALWQAEVMCDVHERVDKRQRLEDAADRAHAAALQAQHRKR